MLYTIYQKHCVTDMKTQPLLSKKKQKCIYRLGQMVVVKRQIGNSVIENMPQIKVRSKVCM